MTNLPSNVTPAKPPAPQTRAEADLLVRYQNAVETTAAGHFSISDRRAPDGEDRRALMARRGELSASLNPSDPREVVKRVARLFMRFPSTRLPEGHAEAVMAAYAADLACFPLWAIDAACLAVIGGRADVSKSFAPSSIEMRDACQKVMAPVQAEIAQLSKVLDAEIYREPTEAEKGRIQALFRELVEELSLNVDPRDKATRTGKRVLTKDEAQAALDRAQANPIPAPKMSPTLRAHLGIKDEEDAA